MSHAYVRLAGIALIVAGCTALPVPRVPVPITPQADVKGAPVVRRPMDQTPFPPHILYTCLTDVAGQRKQIAIEFAGKVDELCRKHPEMGPCQYEREVCRRAGGRVFAADGSEITAATEAAYDKRVLRARFRAN